MTSRASRPDAERRRAAFVEAFGEELTRSGMNRMAARAFAAIAASDGGQRTAADLSEELRASPAAISGAVRYLEQVDMIRRSRPLGSRRDVFSLTDDVWYEALTHRGSVVERWRDMSPSERDAWRRLVHYLANTPPMPQGVDPLPPFLRLDPNLATPASSGNVPLATNSLP